MPTILIVDDDRHTRKLFESVLQHDPRVSRFGASVVQAGDGEEGLKLAAEHHPDLVITDLLMPRMDGFQFCEELRKTDHGRGIGLIVVSGVYRDPSISTRVRDEFGGVFFTKPYQLKEVVGAVEKLLGRAADATPVPDAAVTSPPGEIDGRFEETPLSRLLVDLWERKATGMLQIRRGRVEKRIDLVVGHPVSVSSNQRQETLGEFLAARGVITHEQHQEALERASDSKHKIGEALIELGALTPAELLKQLTAQARFKIVNALRWPDGVWSYKPNRDLGDRAKGNALDPIGVVLFGLKRTVQIDAATRAASALMGRRTELTARGRKLLGAASRVFGDKLIGAIEKAATVDELFGRFEPATLVPALEALHIIGCLQPADEAREHAGREAGDPLALEHLSGSSKGTLEFLSAPVDELAAYASAATGGAPARRTRATSSSELYDALFGDEPSHVQPLPGASDGIPVAPLQGSESSVLDMGVFGTANPVTADNDDADRARDELLGEYLRIQGKDLYAILAVPRDADDGAIARAHAEKTTRFSLETYAAYDLGRDYAKLEELHAAYRRVLEVLGDPQTRSDYDTALIEAEAARHKDPLRGELAFREGAKLLEAGDVDAAVKRFREAIAHAPDMADYHAAFGWALHLRNPDDPEALEQLDAALWIDADHAAAHEYSGRVLVEADGPRAIAHLERALDAHPPRLGALEPLRAVRGARGEWRDLERAYRKLLHRVGTDDRALALRLWLDVVEIHRDRLGDVAAARTALHAALRLSPSEPAILEALAAISTNDPSYFDDRAEALRARWRGDRGDPAPLRELFRAAVSGNHADWAFVAAGALVARGAADEEAAAYHRRYRPRFLLRAQRGLDLAIWPDVRHPEDEQPLGDLFALLDGVAAEVAPMSLADLDVRPEDAVPEARLPVAFAAVRDYVAHTLGVPPPRVYARADFGDQVHVGATSPPVLLAGPGALASTDRVALGFHLGRAMTYLWPGRAVGGSRPSRVLKALLTAAVHTAHPQVSLEEPTGIAAPAARAIAALPGEHRQRLKVLVGDVTQGRQAVNLSHWARALARSADRAGLLLCGDVALAASLVQTPESVEDLVDYAISPEHTAAREALALSIAV